jgi:hypothetical protein
MNYQKVLKAALVGIAVTVITAGAAFAADCGCGKCGSDCHCGSGCSSSKTAK